MNNHQEKEELEHKNHRSLKMIHDLKEQIKKVIGGVTLLFPLLPPLPCLFNYKVKESKQIYRNDVLGGFLRFPGSDLYQNLRKSS